MKVSELLTEAREPTDKGYYTPAYDAERKILIGTVKDWLARLKIEPADIKEAIKLAKQLPSYEALADADVTTAAEAKNGTFSFEHPSMRDLKASMWDGKYHVYANGQIRMSSLNTRSGDRRPTRLATPKPHIVAGDPVKSLVAIYNTAFKEVAKKAAKVMKESHGDGFDDEVRFDTKHNTAIQKWMSKSNRAKLMKHLSAGGKAFVKIGPQSDKVKDLISKKTG